MGHAICVDTIGLLNLGLREKPRKAGGPSIVACRTVFSNTAQPQHNLLSK